MEEHSIDLGVDHDVPDFQKTNSEIEISYMEKVERFLPMWESWLAKNLDLLSKFEQWESVADRKIVAAGYGLQKAIQEKAEAALNNAHDLWCIKKWITGKLGYETFWDDELELLEEIHGIRSDVIQHMMPRLNRICELENHPYLSPAEPLGYSNEDWMERFLASRWGRSVVKDSDLEDAVPARAKPPNDGCSWLPVDAVYAEYVDSINEAREESVANYQRRYMFELLHEIVLESPFKQFMLIHSQVKGVLTDRQAIFVKDTVAVLDEN